MRRFLTTCALFALILPVLVPFSTPSFAQESTVRKITLGEAHRLFRQNNLELMIARSRADESAALIRDAAAYPNPSASVTHETLSSGNEDASESYFNLSQRILWPGVRGARITEASRLAEAVAWDLAADSVELSYDVSRVFTEVVAAAERVRIVGEVTTLFREADRASGAMLDEGETSGYELRRLRVERARYENRFSEAILAHAAARRRLELLILPGAGLSEVLTPVPEPAPVPRDVDREHVLELAMSHRAELESADASMAAAVARERLFRRERRPDPVVTAGYKRQDNGLDGLFLGLGTPVPVFDRNRGAIEAAQARIHATQTRRILVERSIEADVGRTWETYNSLVERHAVIASGLLADVDALLSAARASYAEGEMTLVELLDAAEAYRDARTSTLDLETDLRVAYYDLVRAAGGSITH